ncbi:MAG TPA: hypothetical protein VJQ57_13050 [Acidimicrobiia bacterium]|nr:hypothetical protein [Acidimicrobiia bacterium]
MSHIGLERMEASTWRPSYGPHRPLLSSEPRLYTAVWFIVAGALLVSFVLSWAALVEMNRTYPPVIDVPERMHFTALDPDTGLPVPRAQWIEEAVR